VADERNRCTHGPLNYNHGVLDPNYEAIRTNRGRPCRPRMDVRPTHLDVLTQKTSVEASAKISASRHRCWRYFREQAPNHPSCRVWAPNPNSNCLAVPDVENCSPDRGVAIQ
jgi:hypothetical protein